MEDKEVIKMQDKKRAFDVCVLVMGIVFILAGVVYVIIDNMISDTANFIYLMCWLGYSVCFIVVWLTVGLTMKSKQEKIRVNNYNFDREAKPEQTITTFEAVNIEEKVIFNRKKLRYAGIEISYDELKFDYITYNDDILLHIYSKESEESPLLIFKVTEEFYYCMKFFKLHLEELNKEIDMFNLNFKK